MFCPKCGAQNKDGAKFCGKCGAPISVPRQPDSQAAQAQASGAARAVAPSTQAAHPVAVCAATTGARTAMQTAAHMNVKLIAGVGVALVVAIVVVLFATGVLGGPGKSSAEAVAQSTTASFGKIIDGGFSQASTLEALTDLVGLMPPDAVAALKEDAGVEDNADLVDQLDPLSSLSESFDSDSYAKLAEQLAKLDISYTFSVGDSLSSSDLKSIRTELSHLGVEGDVSEGYDLSMTMSITALEDISDMDKGETEKDTSDESGFYAIKIGDAWYLWLGGL